MYFVVPSIQNSRIGKTTVIETRPVFSWGWGKALPLKEQVEIWGGSWKILS